MANVLSEVLDTLARVIRRDAKKIEKPEELQDLAAAADRLDGLAEGIEQWRTQELADSVYWIEASSGRQRRRIELAAAPLDVGPILREELFTKVPSVIMTSATLATAGRFDFFKSRVGLLQTESLCAGQPLRLPAAGPL